MRLPTLACLFVVASLSSAQTLTGLSVPTPGRAGTPVTGQVTIGTPAGASGSSALLSSNSPDAVVPAKAIIPAGSTTGNFLVTLYNPGYTRIVATITATKDLLERSVDITILPPNYATFANQTIPISVTAGESFPVTLQFKNPGGRTWDAAHLYRLQSRLPTDNTTWGVSRLQLMNGPIDPGQVGIFSGTLTAPQVAGNYTMQWRCIQDDIKDSFGSVSPQATITVNPAIDASQFVSQTGVPASIVVGATFSPSITFKNTGTSTWTSAAGFSLKSCNPYNNTTWGLNTVALPSSVAPQASVTFNPTCTAPTTPGTYSFAFAMFHGATFAEYSPIVNVTVLASDASQFIGQTGVPASISAGATFSPSITFKNTGASTWTSAAGYSLKSRNPYNNTTWGLNTVALPYSVSTGATVTFAPTFTAPTTPGTYSFAFVMFHGATFAQYPPVVNINVLGVDNASVVGQSIPSSVSTNAQFTASVTFANTGSTVWTPAGNYWAVSQNPLLNTTWSVNKMLMPANASVGPNGTITLSATATAPATPGTYSMQWQMSNNSSPFGAASTVVAIQVTGGVAEDAQYISQNVPTTATAGQHYIATVTFKNNGTANWPLNTAVGIYPQPNTSWALDYLHTGSVITVGNSRTYTLDLVAPYIAGSYSLQFRMRDKNTNTWFGQTSPMVSVTVGPSVYAQSPWPGFNGGRYRMTSRGYGSGAVGTFAWSFPTASYVRTGAAIGADGTVYIGCDDGFLYALNGATGVLKWKTSLGSIILTVPAIGSDGTVYVGSEGDNVSVLSEVDALDGATGAVKWKHTVTSGGAAEGIVLSQDGTTLYLTTIFHVLALNTSTGSQKWESAQGTDEITPVIAPDGSILVTNSYPKLIGLDPNTGSIAWSIILPSGNPSQSTTPVIGIDGTIYGIFGSHAYAIDGVTHAIKWDHQLLGSAVRGFALGADGTLYFGGWNDHHLYALDSATGNQKWSFATVGDFFSTPAIAADGTIYAATYDNATFYALDGETGALKFSLTLGGADVASDPAIGADGTVYIGDCGSAVRAIK